MIAGCIGAVVMASSCRDPRIVPRTLENFWRTKL